MTGPENYRRAELLLAQVRNHGYGGGEYTADLLAAAQAHAALALAAAMALNSPVDAHGEGGMLPEDANAWYAVAGTKGGDRG